MMNIPLNRLFAVPLLALALAGCGGGSDDVEIRLLAVREDSPGIDCELRVVGEMQVAVGQVGMAAALFPCSAPPDTVYWEQVGGPAVILEQNRDQSLFFHATDEGRIQLRVTALRPDGRSVTTEAGFDVLPAETDLR